MRIWVKVLGPTLYVVLGLVEFQKKKKKPSILGVEIS